MSFVTQISGDYWPKGDVLETEEYQLEDAMKAIANLDGKKRTEVSFFGGDRFLTVGGGNEGRYHMFIGVNIDQEFFNFVDPVKGDEEVTIVTGGQMGVMPKSEIATLEQVQEAVRHFMVTGEPSPALQWKHEA
jgi:Immunity protein Imm1